MTSSASSSSDNAIPSRADRIAGYRESLSRIGTGDVKVGASIGATIRVGKTKKRVQRTIDVLVERESLDAAVDAILAARAKIAALGEVENLVREGHLDESVLAEHRAEIDAELAGTAE